MNFKSLLLSAVAAIISIAPVAAKTSLNDAESAAQRSMADYLRANKFAVEIDPKDQSVNFKKGDILFWITFDGNSSRMLFTLHRKPIRLDSDKDNVESLNRKCEVAVKAVDRVNANNEYKAFLKGSRVQFQFPVYAASAKEYQAVFPKVLTSMGNVKDEFDAMYKRSRADVDSIHKYWADIDTMHVVVPQRGVKGTVPARNLKISNIAVRNITADDAVISDYDQGLRKNKCQFLQEKVTLTAPKAGIYKLGLKIITPDGKIMVPSKDAVYTTVTTLEVPKANKPAEYTLLKFGQEGLDLWDAGEYKLLFYEDDTVIYEDAVNIL